jgi:hypothetical protein
MPALAFQKQFVPAVENGIAELAGRKRMPHKGVAPKRQTIRAPRKDGRHFNPGDRLILGTGARTKAYRQLGIVKCSHAYEVTITSHGVLARQTCGECNGEDGQCPIAIVKRKGDPKLSAWVCFRLEVFLDSNGFAQLDGFPDFDAMVTWIRKTHGTLPFRGWVYRW